MISSILIKEWTWFGDRRLEMVSFLEKFTYFQRFLTTKKLKEWTWSGRDDLITFMEKKKDPPKPRGEIELI